ncbi:pentatricopeptide repeat-containing protein At5g18950 [Cornus florida]|uniref:pentatricopeptide repeat-containing protein At5g18950 n=1 Tax=Cornus florida TaxID=4283 RepID=UPI002896F65B|nr:pentatricopeptide repeat-containing protein At5g18950 [Cornus florida]
MARPSSSFANLFLRQNPRTIQNPNHQIRNIGVGGDISGEASIQNQKQLNPHQQKHQNFTEIAREVSKVIRSRPRWEQTLLSDFPTINFFDPNFVREVLKHQNNAFLSFRFFHWLTSLHGFVLDPSSCNLVFCGLVEAKAADAAKSFLDCTHFTPEPASLELYIQCLCENGSIDEALAVFDQLKSLNITPSFASWNSALLGSVRAERTDVVWKLYGEMMECGVAGDVDTVGYLIQAFCIEKKVSNGYELLRQVLADGNVPSNVTFNKLISGFCNDGHYSRVSALLHTMIAKNCAPDIYTYQEIIRGLCKRRTMRVEGFRIFKDLKDRGYAPDRVMYTTMIHGLCKMKWIGDARKLWFEMIHKGILPSEYTYLSLIYGLCKIGNIEEAQELYKKMCDRRFRETTISCNIMIGGLCLHGRTKEAWDLFEEMPQKTIVRDVITYNTLIQGFCKEGKIDEGLKLLHEFLEQGLQPSTASYTVLIEKLCEVGHVHEAKELWEDMQYRGVEPAVCTRDFIITGLSEQGYVAEAIEWLATMLRSRLRPRKETFERTIHCLSQGDKLDDALLIIDCMLKRGFAVGESICHSVVEKLCEKNSHHVGTCLVDILEHN